MQLLVVNIVASVSSNLPLGVVGLVAIVYGNLPLLFVAARLYFYNCLFAFVWPNVKYLYLCICIWLCMPARVSQHFQLSCL